MKAPTQKDLAALITAFAKEKPKLPPGKGWETVAQMADRLGINYGAMDRRLRLAMRRGLKLERFTGSDYNEAGVLHRTIWYRA